MRLVVAGGMPSTPRRLVIFSSIFLYVVNGQQRGGQFCRGAACSYRVDPPVVEAAAPVYPNAQQEFCRGLSCAEHSGFGKGQPVLPAHATFLTNCAHLYDDQAKSGKDLHGQCVTLDQATAWSDEWCKTRVGITAEVDCPGYVDVMLMGLVNAGRTAGYCVGNEKEICSSAYGFVSGAKKSFINLRLVQEAFPTQSFLNKGRMSTSKNCTDGARARADAWRQRVQKAGLLQMTASKKVDVSTIDHYKNSPPCDAQEKSSSSYILAEGAGSVPATEVPGALMDQCVNMFSEIMVFFNNFFFDFSIFVRF